MALRPDIDLTGAAARRVARPANGPLAARAHAKLPRVKETGFLSGEDLLAVLAEASDDGGAGVSVRDLAEATGRDRKLVTRVVNDLTELGIAEIDPHQRVARLGWRLRALAAQVVDQRLTVRGQATVEHLALENHESAYLVTRRGTSSVTLAEAMPDLGVRAVSWLGRSQPVVRGDAGPILLMDLTAEELNSRFGSVPLPYTPARRAPRTLNGIQRLVTQARRQGFIVLEGQVEDEVASVGAPVYDFRSRLVGALVIVGPSPRIGRELPAHIEAVTASAADLSRTLGGEPWTPETCAILGQDQS